MSQRTTDVRKRTVLPNTLQNLRSNTTTTSGGPGGDGDVDSLTSDEYLDKMEEELNRKVDHDVLGLVEGFKDVVALARLDSIPSHPSQASLRSLQSQLRTQQMLRNAHSLLSLSHQLKLLHLFGDTETTSKGREERGVELDEEIRRLKEEVDRLARGRDSTSS